MHSRVVVQLHTTTREILPNLNNKKITIYKQLKKKLLNNFIKVLEKSYFFLLDTVGAIKNSATW